MESFISWIGGKKLLRKKILEEFPESGTFKRYIEVFGVDASGNYGYKRIDMQKWKFTMTLMGCNKMHLIIVL